jgi:hypothetical protein
MKPSIGSFQSRGMLCNSKLVMLATPRDDTPHSFTSYVGNDNLRHMSWNGMFQDGTQVK